MEIAAPLVHCEGFDSVGNGINGRGVQPYNRGTNLVGGLSDSWCAISMA